jgi:hypothetical protein
MAQDYTFKISCTTSCAFLLSVERGPPLASNWGNHVGSFPDAASNPRIREYVGIFRYISVVSTQEFMASDYSIRWRSPMELTYETLFVRVTYVLDDSYVCQGQFTQFALRSRVVCGDDFLEENVEECDDGNQISGARSAVRGNVFVSPHPNMYPL